MASAAVPVVFPPVRIAAQSEQRGYEEMHADGGIATQVFTVPEAVLVSAVEDLDVPRSATDLHIIMNFNLTPQFQVVEDGTFPIIERSLSTLLKTHARSELNATYAFAERTGIGFRMTSIDLPTPEDLDPFEYNTEHMRALYQSGYERALAGEAWDERPPAARDGGPSHRWWPEWQRAGN